MIKIVHNSEIKLLHVKPKSLSELIDLIKEGFKGKLKNSFTINYIDTENDKIVVSTQEDFDIMIFENNGSNFKIFINEKKENVNLLEEKKIQNDSLIELNNIKHIVEDKNQELDLTFKRFLSKEEKNTIAISPDKNVTLKNCKKCNGTGLNHKFKFCKKCLGFGKQVLKERNELKEEKKRENKRHLKKLISKEIQKSIQVIVEGVVRDIKKPLIEKSNEIIHQGVSCDNCEDKDIKGIRYKCAVCKNFDFCENCESFVKHPHPFLKIRNPSYCPAEIICILENNDSNSDIRNKLNDLVCYEVNFYYLILLLLCCY